MSQKNWSTLIDCVMAMRWMRLPQLQGQDRIEALMDGCRLIETLVLAENPVLAMPLRFLDECGRDPLIGTAIREGVLDVGTTEVLEEIVEKSLNKWQEGTPGRRKVLNDAFTSAASAVTGEVQRGIYVASAAAPWAVTDELLTGMAARGTTRNPESIAVARARVAAIRAAGAAIGMDEYYDRLASNTTERLTTLRLQGKPIPIVLPPIASVVFSAAANSDALGACVVDLRRELTDARRTFAEKEAKIVSNDVSIGESLDAYDELQEAFNKVLGTKGKRELLAMSEWKDLASVAKSATEGLTTGGVLGAVGGLLGKPVKALDEKLQRRQVLHLEIIRDRFRQIVQYGDIVPRLFGFEVSENDVVTAERRATRLPHVTLQEFDNPNIAAALDAELGIA